MSEEWGDRLVKHHDIIRAWMDAHPGMMPGGAFDGTTGSVWIERDHRVLASANYDGIDHDDAYAGALVAVSVGEAFAWLVKGACAKCGSLAECEGEAATYAGLVSLCGKCCDHRGCDPLPYEDPYASAFDPCERAAEKAAQRAEDELALAEGRVTPEQLRERNAPLAKLLCRPDFSAARMR